MADPTVKLNRKMTDPGLSDLLDLFRKDLLLNLNCHAIATVQNFDPSQQTISATINYKKSYLRLQADGIYRMELIDYPVLIDVPIVIMGGGTAHLSFPISPGDECLILFNDRDIDNWFQSGSVTGLASGRLHSFSDGFALIGVNSMAHLIDNYDTLRAVLFNGTTLVGVSPNKVKIANNLHTLNALLQELVDDIKDLVTATAAITVGPGSFNVTGTPVTGASSTPNNAGAISAVTTELINTATKIGELLE